MRVCGAEAWADGGLVGPPPPLWPCCHCSATLGPLRAAQHLAEALHASSPAMCIPQGTPH